MFSPGKFHGQSLAGYSPSQNHKELDRTELLSTYSRWKPPSSYQSRSSMLSFLIFLLKNSQSLSTIHTSGTEIKLHLLKGKVSNNLLISKTHLQEYPHLQPTYSEYQKQYKITVHCVLFSQKLQFIKISVTFKLRMVQQSVHSLFN